MSLQLLHKLNGNRTGGLQKFINNLGGKQPRIAWYPSAGEDFRALLYLHPAYQELMPVAQGLEQLLPPDIFIFSDYYPWEHSNFLDKPLIYQDKRTTVTVDLIEALPSLNLPRHPEIVEFPEGSVATGRCIFLNIAVQSTKLDKINFPVIYVFEENESFYANCLIPQKASINTILHIRYGGGLGGGGKAAGGWLSHVLEKLNCDLFITDGRHHLQSGDHFAMELFPSIPRACSTEMTTIRTTPSRSWSHYGDVTWNLVRKLP